MDIANPGKFMLWLLKLESRLKSTRYSQFCEKLALNGNENVLEFGCGWGGNSLELAKRLPGGNLLCIDISPVWIEFTGNKLSKTYPKVRYLCGDITKLRAETETMDCIVIHRVLHDIPAEKRLDIIKSLKQWLKQQGEIYIKEPVKHGHGMPVSEIRDIFSKCMLKEDYFELDKKQGYFGIFTNE